MMKTKLLLAAIILFFTTACQAQDSIPVASNTNWWLESQNQGVSGIQNGYNPVLDMFVSSTLKKGWSLNGFGLVCPGWGEVLVMPARGFNFGSTYAEFSAGLGFETN